VVRHTPPVGMGVWIPYPLSISNKKARKIPETKGLLPRKFPEVKGAILEPTVSRQALPSLHSNESGG